MKSYFEDRKVGVNTYIYVVILSLVSARETKNMYNIYLYLILLLSVILNVITVYINFILDVKLS